ncbi:hypothetical protein NDA11_003214 [Ustilago hordei]|uniref:Related to citrate lyase beta subunit n=1 Tax=Ustilago hordei TaxID=120017 RepID=I2FR86_USTHO|nr:uncharacterized protein UHO2_05571 [Ustilago hordei]KAJ1042695.1 hypothetical protein NDA10_007618 [Ustilago hordei]KAJ1572800.1 hypothetical protein NDA15_004203 [Ustilago hordei]KAJ1575209.1 hypothetical protein NDA11_003214 [Ustilago hordei]KAJ1575714.1 hypothetical protein NDA12_003216 [Ustilago hordei]KAJ1598034.1 hypothetical protein NDA14_002615 [Ustilago hordei]
MPSKRIYHQYLSTLPKRPTLNPRVLTAAPTSSSLPTRSISTTLVTRQKAQHASQPPAPRSTGQPKPSSSDPPSSSTQDARTDLLSRPRRSMLYVPGSSEKMIKKSQSSSSDTIIFDLEDSVAAHKKGSARETVFLALEAAARPGPELAVRINPPSSNCDLAEDDLDMILPSSQLQTIVVPKVESEDDVRLIIEKARALRGQDKAPLGLVLSVESAGSLLRMPKIIERVRNQLGQNPYSGKPGANGKSGMVEIVALLFASEDYCASTGILRTRDRKSLLFPRAHMATIAKGYNLAAIDMVCIDYKDQAYLIEEAEEAKELGYDGKQAIHPVQVDPIQNTFNPTEEAVERAARILSLYEKAEKGDRGAYGLEEERGGMTMIDRPMLLQANAVVGLAKRAGMKVPSGQDLEARKDQ